MEDIYYHTMSFDFPNAVTAGLRNRTDAARGAIERTRGDLTLALQQAELATRLDELKARE
jgi:translin